MSRFRYRFDMKYSFPRKHPLLNRLTCLVCIVAVSFETLNICQKQRSSSDLIATKVRVPKKRPFYRTINDVSNGSHRSNKPETQRKCGLSEKTVLPLIVVTAVLFQTGKNHVCVRQIIRLQRPILFSLRHPVTVTRYETRWVLKLEFIITAVIKP